MSNKLDPAEVLAYLNQLGYHNITAAQLKEFMKDLKKLMKYEKRQKQLATENERYLHPVPSQYTKHPSAVSSSILAPTESSKAKQVVKKSNIISVEITQKSVPFCCNYYNNAGGDAGDVDERQTANNQESRSARDEVSNQVNTESSLVTKPPRRPRSCDIKSPRAKSKSTFRENILKPKASFIVPRGPVKSFKSDPVALYHKYLEGWKKHKSPGEDNHYQLRWAVRERILGQSRVAMSAASSMEQIAKKCKSADRI